MASEFSGLWCGIPVEIYFLMNEIVNLKKGLKNKRKMLVSWYQQMKRTLTFRKRKRSYKGIIVCHKCSYVIPFSFVDCHEKFYNFS